MFLFGKAIIYNIRDWLIYILKVGENCARKKKMSTKSRNSCFKYIYY